MTNATLAAISTGRLPAFDRIEQLLHQAHELFRDVADGRVADYIPALAHADPRLFAMTVAEVDGTVHDAGDALRFAAAEARLRGGELHVVHAWIDNLSGYGGPPWARPAATLREQADTTLLESLRAAWQNGPPEVRAETIEGAEWDVLTELAEAADLLVVGSRGRTGRSSSLLGSVALRCITQAPCPVAVVRPLRSAAGTVGPSASPRLLVPTG
ncbi:universal stress protein [Geodermatophilus sp. URMC 60]